MSNYKQKIIPKTSIIKYKSYSKRDLQHFVKNYYKKNYQNKISVKNLDLGITIDFIGKGKNKSAYGAAMYSKKAAAITILDKLLKYAKYTNWGDKKDNDPDFVIGYLNFKVKFKIDSKITFFALNVQVRNDGKFHYSLDEQRY